MQPAASPIHVQSQTGGGTRPVRDKQLHGSPALAGQGCVVWQNCVNLKAGWTEIHILWQVKQLPYMCITSVHLADCLELSFNLFGKTDTWSKFRKGLCNWDPSTKHIPLITPTDVSDQHKPSAVIRVSMVNQKETGTGRRRAHKKRKTFLDLAVGLCQSHPVCGLRNVSILGLAGDCPYRRWLQVFKEKLSLCLFKAVS